MKSVISMLFLSAFALISKMSFSQSKLGIFEGHADIGTNVKPGFSIYIPQNDQYVVTGAGYNVWFDHDEFHYVYKKIKGDFILYTRAEFVGWNGVEPHRKLGWMVRKTLDGKSAHINAVVHGDGRTSLQHRKADGATTDEIISKTDHANIIQLERKGKTYTMRVAKYSEPFVVDSMDLDLGNEVYVGLFVGSHNADVVETGVFRDVQISVPAREGLIPYREYLGSNLEILEVASGSREIVYTSPKSIQAPNWTRDGKTLIYNSDGLIYRFDLATRKPRVLNTGEVKNNNNDHVLSFDGKVLGLSSGVQALGGSIIYTVPVTGGRPTQITPRGPSYLHSWSPDGKTLVFAGRRNNEFDIYTIPSNGGNEVQLTTAKGVDDGPEYTPDGKYIYFNSSRTGTMQIWRMKPDGSDQEAVTTDGEFHDWFPHISPDGEWIAMVSFLKEEVSADDHPFYKHVYIRLMPITGGKPKVIAYVYGGQGTMNTPSWSPDGKRIAFISNSDMPGTNVKSSGENK
jgi:Tol biopolymer transport system component